MNSDMNCSTCHYCRAVGSGHVCRRNPPTSTIVMAQTLTGVEQRMVSMWPSIRPEIGEFCGEWIPEIALSN